MPILDGCGTLVAAREFPPPGFSLRPTRLHRWHASFAVDEYQLVVQTLTTQPSSVHPMTSLSSLVSMAGIMQPLGGVVHQPGLVHLLLTGVDTHRKWRTRPPNERPNWFWPLACLHMIQGMATILSPWWLPPKICLLLLVAHVCHWASFRGCAMSEWEKVAFYEDYELHQHPFHQWFFHAWSPTVRQMYLTIFFVFWLSVVSCLLIKLMTLPA